MADQKSTCESEETRILKIPRIGGECFRRFYLRDAFTSSYLKREIKNWRTYGWGNRGIGEYSTLFAKNKIYVAICIFMSKYINIDRDLWRSNYIFSNKTVSKDVISRVGHALASHFFANREKSQALHMLPAVYNFFIKNINVTAEESARVYEATCKE